MTRTSRKSGEGNILHLFASLPEDANVLEAIAVWTAKTWTPVSTLLRLAIREWLDAQMGKRPRRHKPAAHVAASGYQPRPAKWCADLLDAIAGDGSKKNVVLHVFLSASDPADVRLSDDLRTWRMEHFNPPVSALLKAAALTFVQRHDGKLTPAERTARIEALRAAVQRTYPAAAYTRKAAAEAAGALPPSPPADAQPAAAPAATVRPSRRRKP